MFRPNTDHLQVSSWKAVRKMCYTIMQTRTGARLHNCITHLTNSFSRWNLKMASVRPKHVVSNFFMSWFLIITSIRKLLVVLLTASPYRHLIYYTTGLANLKTTTTAWHTTTTTKLTNPARNRVTWRKKAVQRHLKTEAVEEAGSEWQTSFVLRTNSCCSLCCTQPVHC